MPKSLAEVTMLESYGRRPAIWLTIKPMEWENWRWQQQHSIRSLDSLLRTYPGLDGGSIHAAQNWATRGFRLRLTPYMLSLMEHDHNALPRRDDPVWRQFFPPQLSARLADDEYCADKENWEKPEEMLTPILQRKYPDRAIVCATDSCFGYCTYCFRSLQSRHTRKRHGGLRHWKQTLKVLAGYPDIEEIILSGGEPLILSDERLESMLRDLRRIKTVRTIRIHTRACTHNPYRFSAGLGVLLKRYGVTAMCLHVQHPRELTKELADGLDELRDAHPHLMLLSQTVLMKGVNDDSTTLGRLFMDLYRLGIKPYYLFHMMPNIPAADVTRTSVVRGAVIMRELRHRMTGPALPEYVLSPMDGKRTVPQELDGTPEFRYKTDRKGRPVVRFKNWQGCWVTYPDVPDPPLDRQA